MALLDKLPGMLMTVSEIPGAMRDLWKSDPSEGEGATRFRAIQANLVLHLGLETTEAEAGDIFNRALEFAQRHPCRLICLCPSLDDGDQLIRGKLFSQCYLTGGARHPVCCEALMLGYSPDDAEFLEHQVSIWLESDLPTYHWFHRVPAQRIIESYLPFLKMVRRVTFDSSLEGHAYEEIAWPCPRGARDLADARLLHVRQSVGQFLSSYPMEVLSGGLQSVGLRHGPRLFGEALNLAAWVRKAFGEASACEVGVKIAGGKDGLNMHWEYDDGKSLLVELNDDLSIGRICAEFGSGSVDYPLHLKKASSQLALAEALFC